MVRALHAVDVMLTVGDPLPQFALQAIVGGDEGRDAVVVTPRSYPDRWLVLFFWPMDFTLVCPGEILEFARLDPVFRSHGAQVLGASIDSPYAHRAWRERDPDIREVPFPMIADPQRELCGACGIVERRTGVAMRATFLVDPTRTIRWAIVHDLECGRNVAEVLRVLQALRMERPTPYNWQPGDATLFA